MPSATHTAKRNALTHLLFGRQPVARGPYLITGLVLLVLKYVGEAIAVYTSTGQIWPVDEFLFPSVTQRSALFGSESTLTIVALWIWSIPFIFVATWMSARRAIDAGLSGLLALLLFLPFLNFGMIGLLCMAPSVRVRARHVDAKATQAKELEKTLLPVTAGVAVGMAMFLLSVYALGDYGLALMVGTPVVLGVIVATLSGGQRTRSMRLALVTCLILCALLLIPGLEGLICIAMALLPMLVLASIGVLIVHAISTPAGKQPRKQACWSMLLLPALLTSDGILSDSPELQVTTSIEIDAPIERVWRCVIEFSELPEPEEWIFRLGIAYPKRAEIRGRGVGAVRHCIFSTGAFVEPITVWNEPTHLAFDVAQQPDPMRELSPYAHVHPPHLDGGFRSLRGEFRLERLSASRTRVHGTTWYELDVRPHNYWMLWTDGLIHAIHRRVLEHIRTEASNA